jgi:type I site-specific restriction endonuclease
MPSPEDKARENIDRLLTQTGWAVRDQRSKKQPDRRYHQDRP